MFELFGVIFVCLFLISLVRAVFRGSRSSLPGAAGSATQGSETAAYANDALDELHDDFVEDKWFDKGSEVTLANNIGFNDDFN